MYQCNKTDKTSDFNRTDISTCSSFLQERKLWEFDEDNYIYIYFVFQHIFYFGCTEVEVFNKCRELCERIRVIFPHLTLCERIFFCERKILTQ